MKKTNVVLLSAILLALILPLQSTAHLDGGEDRLVDDFIVDFGFSPAQLTTYEASLLDLIIKDQATQRIITPEKIELRISQSDITLSSANIDPSQKATVTHFFQKPGTYDITPIVTLKDNKEIKTTFQVTVQGKANHGFNPLVVVISAAGGAIIVCLFIIICKRIL